jgi:formiminotetrahydrofolate cyclodeaminase
MSVGDDYRMLPLGRFWDDVAARTPSPGGGSVAASVGALAAALARMTVEYTAGKKQYAEHEGRLRELLDELRRAGDMFGELMAEDMAAYERYAAARKSGDAAEQARATATAVAVPMEIAAVAEAVVARLDAAKGFLNPALCSDVQVAAILAEATAASAVITARGNLGSLPDPAEARTLAGRLDSLLAQARAHRDAVVAYDPARPSEC